METMSRRIYHFREFFSRDCNKNISGARSARRRKIQAFFPNLRLILASVYDSNHVSVKHYGFRIHRFKTLAPVHRSNNISECLYSQN